MVAQHRSLSRSTKQRLRVLNDPIARPFLLHQLILAASGFGFPTSTFRTHESKSLFARRRIGVRLVGWIYRVRCQCVVNAFKIRKLSVNGVGQREHATRRVDAVRFAGMILTPLRGIPPNLLPLASRQTRRIGGGSVLCVPARQVVDFVVLIVHF